MERICRGGWADQEKQPALRKLAGEARREDVVAGVEAMKEKECEQFQDRDWGRDLALYLGRKYC